MTNSASLCQTLGGLRNRSFNTMKSILEDLSFVAAQQERSWKEKSWTLSLNAEGFQEPLNQRSDFQEAKQTSKRLYHESTAVTGSGTKPIPPELQVRQRLDQQFEGLEEYDHRLEAST